MSQANWKLKQARLRGTKRLSNSRKTGIKGCGLYGKSTKARRNHFFFSTHFPEKTLFLNVPRTRLTQFSGSVSVGKGFFFIKNTLSTEKRTLIIRTRYNFVLSFTWWIYEGCETQASLFHRHIWTDLLFKVSRSAFFIIRYSIVFYVSVTKDYLPDRKLIRPKSRWLKHFRSRKERNRL